MLKAGLLGYPIEHSLSPAIHNATYEALGLPWEYALYPCADRAAFVRILEEARRNPAQFVGFNVTTPWKIDAFESCDECSVFASAVGNANVLTFFGADNVGADVGTGTPAASGAVGTGTPVASGAAAPRSACLRGDNTDGPGLVASLVREAGVELAASSVVLCGTGPVARSVLLSLAEKRVGLVCVASRNPDKARAELRGFCERLDRAGKRDRREEFPLPEIRVIGYDGIAESLATATILIDATSVGMKPGDGAVVEPEALHSGLTVLDVVYGHGETALLRAAREVGATALDGLGMLVEQAALTIELWAHAQGIQVEVPRGLWSK
jgi:shikimate dehydrogenase